MLLNELVYTQNRDISWLNYTGRILDEARDKTVPALERFNYISLFMKNLNEYMSLKEGQLIGEENYEDDALAPGTALTESQIVDVCKTINEMLSKKDVVHTNLEADLEAGGVIRVGMLDLLPVELEAIDKFYVNSVRGALKTNIVSDNGEFPQFVSSKSYLIAKLAFDKKTQYGIIDIPYSIPKVLVLEEGMPYISNVQFTLGSFKEDKQHASFSRPFRYILTEDIIKMHVHEFFKPFDVEELHTFNIIQSDELSISKLIVDGNMTRLMHNYFDNGLNLDNDHIFTTDYIDYGYVNELKTKLPAWLKADLCWSKDEPFNQLKLGYGSMIDRLKRREFLSCYPYDSIDPLYALLEECSSDKRVRELRVAIYRLSSKSSIIGYLKQAAQSGKKVSVVMDESAQYDEKWGINWKDELLEAGVKVIPGNTRFRIHASLIQIVLHEDGNNAYITHISTGDLIEKKASKYTDFAFITYDQKIGKSANEAWQDMIDNKVGSYTHLLASPTDMKRQIIDLIKIEAGKGEMGRIFMKLNGLTDMDIITELKNASCAGCKIRLIVRGVCCLVPGIKGVTENIDIVSVVGRYVEHSRVYIFGKGRYEIMLISTADLMTRNMTRRVELACPIYNYELRKRIKAIMYLNYVDNVKGRQLGADGKYHRKLNGNKRINSQEMLMG